MTNENDSIKSDLRYLSMVCVLLMLAIGVLTFYVIRLNENMDYLHELLSDDKQIGGELDEHGCLPTAGYVWCESKQECFRPWMDDCPGGEYNVFT